MTETLHETHWRYNAQLTRKPYNSQCILVYMRAPIRQLPTPTPAAVSLCVSVCLYPPFFRHDRLTTIKFGTHMRINLGIIRTKKNSKKIDPLHLTPGGILGGQKFKGPGNFMNCPGSFRGKKFKSPGNFINCRYIF